MQGLIRLANVIAIAVGTGLSWAVIELVVARASVHESAVAVLACSVLVAAALAIPAALAAALSQRIAPFTVSFTFCEVATLGAGVCTVWGYLWFSGEAPLGSSRTALIAALAAVAAIVPAAGAATLARWLASRMPARVAATARGGAILALTLSAWWLAACRQTATPERWTAIGDASEREPNVILIIGDTLRADHVSALGYQRATTPALARLGGTWFSNTRSVANWTRPSVATMLSGLAPATHGVVKITSKLPAAMPTLPEMFARAGFATGFLTANPNTSAVFDFDRGCDVFFDSAAHPLAALLPTTLGQIALRFVLRFDQARFLVREVDRFLNAVATRRFFLTVHFNDPHTPYAPPHPFDQLFAPVQHGRASHDPVHVAPRDEQQHLDAIALYDGEIASLDQALASMVDGLRARRLLAKTAIVFVADHGEEFREHGGYGHGRTLFDEILRVPLLVRPPGDEVAAASIDTPVTLLDVAPTLLALGCVPVPSECTGTNVMSPAIEASRPQCATSEMPRAAAWCEGRNKLVLDLESAQAKLYELQDDPVEQHDVAHQHPELVARLRSALLGALAKAAQHRMAPAELSLSADLLAELRRLGYAK